MIRIFAGIPIPENLTKTLVPLQNGIPEARWVAPENMHITLRFIGDVDENLAEEYAQALDVVSVEPFEATLTSVGTFGRPPHSLWIGVEDHPKGALTQLHKTIDGVLIRAGLEPERRKYTPHMTLARFGKRHAPHARLANHLEAHADLKIESFPVSGFTLFQSVITHHGANYNPLYQYDF